MVFTYGSLLCVCVSVLEGLGAQNACMPFHDSDKMVSELLKFIPARANVLTSL